MEIKKSITELCRVSIQQFRNQPKLPICLVADNVRSQHNVGAFFRTADAFALHSICLCGITPQPLTADVHKTALGAELAVEWHHFDSTVEAVMALKQQNWCIVALEQTHNSILLQNFLPHNQKIALIVGNEVEGVDEAVLALCDHVVEIEQFGTKHSLNVSVSAGIALYHLSRQFT